MWTHSRVKRIGRPAFILLPMPKMRDINFGRDGKSPSQLLQDFLMENYHAFTLMNAFYEGSWQDENGVVHPDCNLGIRVSFICPKKPDGRYDYSNLNKLIDFLSELCGLMHEQCLYAEFGEEAVLINPK